MYDAALAVIKEHNSVIGKDKPGYVDPDLFLSCIKSAGGTTLERLKALSYEDMLACMHCPTTTLVKPIAIAKDIAKIFRGKEEAKVNDARPVSAKKAEKMSLLELVQHYDPEDFNLVAKRLGTNPFAQAKRLS
jgi:hypothetical protein